MGSRNIYGGYQSTGRDFIDPDNIDRSSDAMSTRTTLDPDFVKRKQLAKKSTQKLDTIYNDHFGRVTSGSASAEVDFNELSIFGPRRLSFLDEEHSCVRRCAATQPRRNGHLRGHKGLEMFISHR